MLKKTIGRLLVSKFSDFLTAYRLHLVNELRRIKGVNIAQDIILGSGTEFDIYGAFKEICIEQNLVTRKYCNFLVYPSATLIIERNVFFNNFCSINCLGYIRIGENTIFGECVKLYDHNHEYSRDDSGKLKIERDDMTIGKIIIGNNCWIGSNVTILNNVEIGDNVIIGANNLIFKSIPSNTIVKLKTEQIHTLAH